MPGQSAFYVPWSAYQIFYASNSSAQWTRQIPMIQPAISGVADCNALELLTPPTLRTAYDIYAVSIPWAAYASFAMSGFTGQFLAEIALLINGDVRWIGSDAQDAVYIGGTAYIGSGSINADLVNAVRINPRERLSLRLGFATNPAMTPDGALQIEPAVSQAFTVDGGGAHFIATQGTISYNIIDLPGTRKL